MFVMFTIGLCLIVAGVLGNSAGMFVAGIYLSGAILLISAVWSLFNAAVADAIKKSKG